MKNKSVYRIFFTSQNKAYEIYARQVNSAELAGFVEIEDLLFGERSSIVVDPSEEGLKKEFGSVKRLILPYHAINRIDEVEREGPGRVLSLAPGAEGSAPLGFPLGKGPGKG